MTRERETLSYSAPEARAVSHRITHGVIVVVCGMISTFIMLVAANIYGSIRGGLVFIGGMVPIVLVLGIALGVGLYVRVSRWRFKTALVIVCLAPSLLILWNYDYTDKELRRNAPLNGFRELIANPIPASATAIRFEPVGNWGRAQKIIWFEIAKPDLDGILAKKGYVQVTPGTFAPPIDRFNDANYLRIGDDDELYQWTDRGGDCFMLRVNKTHTAAVFRWDDLRY